VGPHKTGTTSLQEALLKQYGSVTPQTIWYPLPGESGPGHAAISRAVLGRKGFTEPQPAIRHQIEEALQTSSCEVLILSSEGFVHAYPDRFASLAEQAVETDTHILVTLSPIARRTVSVWQERVKHGWPIPLDHTEAFLDHAGLAHDFVGHLVRSFPDAKVSVVITDKTSPEKLYAHFSKATGIPLTSPGSPKEITMNRGLGIVEVEILRGLNVARHSANLSHPDYLRAMGLLQRLFKSDKWQATIPTAIHALPKDWIAPMKKRCAETIQELRNLEWQHQIEIFGNVESLDDVTGTE
jgi:hypothetical protein